MLAPVLPLIWVSSALLVQGANPGSKLGVLRRDHDVSLFKLDVRSSCMAGIGLSAWTPSPQTQSADLNLCIEGKQIPSLYLLGAAKCATTSMAQELVSAGAQCAGGRKEYHFFKEKVLMQYIEDPDTIREQWLLGMPPCDTESRILLGDFSPQSLNLVPYLGETRYRDLPSTLSGLYGPHLSKKITFVILLREPLARAQSWFYYGRVPDMTFQAYAEGDLRQAANGWTGHPSASAAFGSRYGAHLEGYLGSFDPSQFFIVPFRAFTSGNSRRICEELSLWLAFDMECGPMTTHRLSSDNPSLEEDTTEEFRQLWREFFEPDKRLLVSLLAEGYAQGMGLASYRGSGDLEDIQGWLEEWW